MRSSRSLFVWTTIPSATGVVHEAGVPLRPSTSIRQSRQEPNASSMSVAQSFGISVPATIAARFDRAELHGEACLPCHVDGIIEDDDAAVADQAVGLGEGLVVEGEVEEQPREIGAERSADLHRAHRPSAPRAAADVVDQLAERDAEGSLVEAGMLDVAGKLDRHGAAR